jgi:hypothetical protein
LLVYALANTKNALNGHLNPTKPQIEEKTMYKIKSFKTRKQLSSWIEANDSKTQWQELFVNNAFAVEYRALRQI